MTSSCRLGVTETLGCSFRSTDRHWNRVGAGSPPALDRPDLRLQMEWSANCERHQRLPSGHVRCIRSERIDGSDRSRRPANHDPIIRSSTQAVLPTSTFDAYAAAQRQNPAEESATFPVGGGTAVGLLCRIPSLSGSSDQTWRNFRRSDPFTRASLHGRHLTTVPPKKGGGSRDGTLLR